jgi:hypothetical protein
MWILDSTSGYLNRKNPPKSLGMHGSGGPGMGIHAVAGAAGVCLYSWLEILLLTVADEIQLPKPKESKEEESEEEEKGLIDDKWVQDIR